MSLVVPAIGLLVAILAAVGVSLHAAWSGRSRRASLLWAGGVGAVTLGGFLFAERFAGAIHRLYFRQLEPVAIARTPYEAAAVLVAVGTGISVLGVLLYVFGRRDGAFGADEPPTR